ncbi:alpha-mannosidase [Anaeramoeba ignava]|uniref:alpha-mannosidase n=1 Tax=Anaeramoeba ignava TaxID=1746090 RepID=A0A9Q0RCX9_ANAIG|nr:alpha-mannosidase [Anaeramoeba ignava]
MNFAKFPRDMKYRVPRAKKYLEFIQPKTRKYTITSNTIESAHNEPGAFKFPTNLSWNPTQIVAFGIHASSFHYFKSTLSVPNNWNISGLDNLEIVINITPNFQVENTWDDTFPAGPEGRVWVNEKLVGAYDNEHNRILLKNLFPSKTRKFDIVLAMFSGRVTALHTIPQFSLNYIDLQTQSLYRDLSVCIDLIEVLKDEDPSKQVLLNAIDAVVLNIDITEELNPLPVIYPKEYIRDPKQFVSQPREKSDILMQYLSQNLIDQTKPSVACIGHSHIDLAWLWPFSVTKHKIVNTFSTQLRLLHQNPNYIFLQSSAQAYKWVEQNIPEQFKEIKNMIKQNRWEVEGSSWVEFDSNIPNGESLSRQILFGKRYFRKKFGVDTKTLWLPDCFGFSASLPSILAAANIEYFITSKISWSEYNKFPYQTFNWVGLDGKSSVLSKFISTPSKWGFSTYNALMTIEEIDRIWKEFNHKNILQDMPLLTFGYGDGGGGPTQKMLDTAYRLSGNSFINNSQNQNEISPLNFLPLPNFPKVKMTKISDLMNSLSSIKQEFPVYDGELYLEYHRGTYTSQAWIKRFHRKFEISLHNLEFLCSLSSLFSTLNLVDNQFIYPKKEIDLLWEQLLLFEFHDVLPGTSVHETYDEIHQKIPSIKEKIHDIKSSALQFIFNLIDRKKFQNPLVLLNSLSWNRSDPILYNEIHSDLNLDNFEVPSFGWTVVENPFESINSNESLTSNDPNPFDLVYKEADFHLSINKPQNKSSVSKINDTYYLKNDFWILQINMNGEIISLFDQKNGRNVQADGQILNKFRLFQDRWDINLYYNEMELPGPKCISIEPIYENNACGVQVFWQFPQVKDHPDISKITQKIILYSTNPRIDFITDVSYYEHHKLLKVDFPVNIRSQTATFEIQFGHISRNTHWNTQFDIAKFETIGHKFVDLSEHGYGVSLINDCKYGYNIHSNIIQLTLIKSSTQPDLIADRLQHFFTYSLIPHKNSFQESRIIQAGYEMNYQIHVSKQYPLSGKINSSFSLLHCSSPSVIIETIKRAEDFENSFVLRVYESYGGHSFNSTIFVSDLFPLKQVKVINLIEDDILLEKDLKLLNFQFDSSKNSFSFDISPFQILTFLLDFEKSNKIEENLK